MELKILLSELIGDIDVDRAAFDGNAVRGRELTSPNQFVTAEPAMP
jgi:hypothetical protein